jgi:hypothetical protein
MSKQSDDFKLEDVNMGQALGVAADMVANYIGAFKPAIPLDDLSMKKFHQMAAAIVIHNIAKLSKHKFEMAGILEVVAGDLREQAKEECTGHVAGNDPMVCSVCGTHIDELRPPEPLNMTDEPLDPTNHPD